MDLARVVLGILALGVLVVVHEAGHYLVALWGGMKVSRFSIGFGPVLLKRHWGDTEFTLSAIPFGGYVQIDGMHPEDGTDPEDPRSYLNRPRHLRAAAVLAGPAANYLLAFVMLVVFFAGFAVEGVPPIHVQKVLAESPADEAGLQDGDLLTGTAGTEFTEIDDLSRVIEASQGAPIVMDVRRGPATLQIPVTPQERDGRFSIGISYHPGGTIPAQLGFGQAVLRAGQEVGSLTQRVVASLGALFTRPDTVSTVGPLGIVDELRNQLKISLAGTFRFVAHLSIMLGFFNLLPIPALDGARLLFLAAGAIRGREIEPRLEAIVHGVGFLALLGMLLVVSWFDVAKLWG